jgi:hypothetical protein
MIWYILLGAAIALGLIKFGAMAVWISVLSGVLQAIVVVAVCAGLWFVWHRYKGPGMH